MSNWNWKVVRQFLKQSFDLGLSRSSCLNYLHRLGFVLKRPKKRLLKAKDEERKAFIIQYSQIREEAERIGAKIFFVDEAHFRADADLRGKWVLKGEPALVDSTSPRWGEKACYYSGVCLESGEVEAMEIAGNSNAETSTAFYRKAKDEERKAFIIQYSQIREEAERIGAKIFFVDEAHFRADADLRGKWVLKGEPALVDSTSPRWERRPATTREFVWRVGRWKPWK